MNYRAHSISRWLPVAMAAALSLPSLAVAQPGGDVASSIAGLREDIRLLDERTRSLTVEIENLRRENRALKDQAASVQYVTVAQFNTALSELEKALRAGDREVALQLTQQMERLAKQTQTALDAMAKSAATSAPTPNFQFTDDYPKTGTTYVIESGDTLSSIAKRFNSSVRDIQNANRIADPKIIQPGTPIFIPQR